MGEGKNFFTLQMKITVLVCSVVALALFGVKFLITPSIIAGVEDNIAKNATNIARLMAKSPVIIEGLSGTRDEKEIQNYAEDMRKTIDVEFIVVMDMNGYRKSHPNASKIGEHFVGGDEQPVLQEGREYTSTATGTLGPSLRAFAPVISADGRQIGAVSVGILLDSVQKAIDQSRSITSLATGMGLLVGIIGAVLLARNVKRTMFGLEPFAIAKLLEERSAILQSVREGILAVDGQCRVTLINREAERIFHLAGIQGNLIGKQVTDCVPGTRLKEVIETGREELDQEQDINGVVILTNRLPIKVNGKIVGAVATFRDKTEIRRLAEQLTGIRNYAEALRAQAHEFMNKLQVILGMVQLECYEQIASYVSSVAQEHRAEVNFAVRRIKDPIFAGFILGKMSYARERGVELIVAHESFLPRTEDDELIHELITIVGNLIDNALESVENTSSKKVNLAIIYHHGMLQCKITDTGTGIAEDQQEQIFMRGFSTKSEDRGLGLFLVRRSIEKLGGNIALSSQPGKGTTFVVELPYESIGESDD